MLLTLEDGTNRLSQNISSQLAHCVMLCPRRAKTPVSAVFKSCIHWWSHCLEFLWKERKNKFYSTKACNKCSIIFGRNTLASPYISFFGLWSSWCHLWRMLSAAPLHLHICGDVMHLYVVWIYGNTWDKAQLKGYHENESLTKQNGRMCNGLIWVRIQIMGELVHTVINHWVS